eukprot:Trichotokara_eunicae@DN5233_c0_g1_i2.p1
MIYEVAMPQGVRLTLRDVNAWETTRLEEIKIIFELYKRRTICEELDMVKQAIYKEADDDLEKIKKEKQFSVFGVSSEIGISQSDFEKRKEIFGSNRPPLPQTTSFCRLLIDAFSDYILRILMVAGLVSLALGLAFGEKKKKKKKKKVLCVD